MQNSMEKIANFISTVQFTDLSENVVHEIKRVILDSIGCAIAGHLTERGRIAAELARQLGGVRESSVIGTNDRVCCANAAFANGELMNALDFDALSNVGRHDVPTLVSATLSLAESTAASGKSLILAIALAIEISGRLKSAVKGIHSSGPEKDKMLWPDVNGYSVATLAAAAGGGKILNFDEDKVANAIGIAGYICPPSTMRKFTETLPVKMVKYGPPGWGAKAAVIAVLLAKMGYTGDTNLFDGEYGFWRYTGKMKGEWNMEGILEDLGTEWLCHQIQYKQYPSCLVMAGLADGLIQIMEENDLQPDDIEKINAQPHPLFQFKFLNENILKTSDDYCFNLPYLLACVAHRINPSSWHELDIKQNPGIRQFMERVGLNVIIDERDFALAKLKDPCTYQMRIEVFGKGKIYKKKISYLKGTWEPEEYRSTDDELVKKFTDNASKFLTLEKVNKAAKTIFEIEKLENVAELMEIVTS